MTELDNSTSAERMLKIGVYQIRNLISSKRYIGSTSVSFQRRWGQHLSSLEKNIHYCKYLQYSWNKHGAESFAFEILEVVDDPGLVIAREQAWIDIHIETGELYNTSPTAGSTRGRRFSDESKAKIGAANRAFYSTPEGKTVSKNRMRRILDAGQWRESHKRGQARRWENPENHIKASEAQRKANGTPERKAEFSARMKRHWSSPEHRERLLAHNRRIASDPEYKAKRKAKMDVLWNDPDHIQKHAEGQRRRFSTDEGKMQASQARRPRDEHGRPISYNLRGPDGTIYLDIPNVAAFCREHDLPLLRIRSVLRREYKTYNEYMGWTIYESPEQDEE
jgi:group I intron endonuclease